MSARKLAPWVQHITWDGLALGPHSMSLRIMGFGIITAESVIKLFKEKKRIFWEYYQDLDVFTCPCKFCVLYKVNIFCVHLCMCVILTTQFNTNFTNCIHIKTEIPSTCELLLFYLHRFTVTSFSKLLDCVFIINMFIRTLQLQLLIELNCDTIYCKRAYLARNTCVIY